jgi:hypothetical protein
VFDDVAGEVTYTQVVVAGVAAEPVERGVHAQSAAFGEDAFGLSMMMRWVSAVWSCSVRISLRVMARSDRIPMVATSASAWPTARSSSGSAPAVEQVEGADRLSAQPHGYRVNRPESPARGDGADVVGPAVGGIGEVAH